MATGDVDAAEPEPRLREVVVTDEVGTAIAPGATTGLTLRSGAASASADRRAARLVGAGGRGIVRKTLFKRIAKVKKPP